MRKNEAKQIITDVYNEVISHIDENSRDISESEIIDFLHDIAQKLFTSAFHLPLNLHSPQMTFEAEYEALAKQGMSSYKNSNDAMASINHQHGIVLEEARVQNLIDSEKITDRFREIQEHMSTEITRANETITALMLQINELEQKSSIDPLTKVLNRKTLDEFMHNACTNYAMSRNLHVLMIDIDDFKYINDTFGHLAGDKVLIFLANIFKKTMREGDKIFRYGGEEFFIVLNRTDRQGSILVAERILELVRQNKLLFKNKQMAITLSIGIAHCQENDSPETIIERADKALYKAKTMGKNQLQIAEE